MARLSKKKIQTDIELMALNIVDKERVNWEDAVCYVTEQVAFRMRQLIRILRKNYWGIFDNAIDPTTNREKVWVPLIQSLVEDVVKNIDLDQKDLQFRAKVPEGYDITDVTRAYVQDYLSKMFFGEVLDETERQLAIDGTVVWKTWEEGGELKRRTVDLLHIYIDPAEESIQTAFRFTERALMTPDEIAQMSGWLNTQDITGSQILSKNDTRVGSGGFQGIPTTGRFVDVWECWGKIPKYLITGIRADMEEYVDGHIIVSGFEAGDKRVHLVELNGNKDNLGNIIKPYEEARIAKIAGRWYGLGIAERALALQEWLNTVDNIRINRNYISQLGLFKVRRGSGITGQMLAKLPSNGAISVNDVNDIQQFDLQSVDPSSYKDEEVIQDWAQKVTQAFPVSTGEALPASQSATAVATQNTASKSGYAMMKDGLAFFLERWMDRHALKVIAKTIKVGDLVHLTGDDDQYRKMVEVIVSNLVKDKLDELYEKGIVPSEQEVQATMQDEIENLTKKGGTFVKLVQEVIASQLQTKFYVTNEDLDTTVTVQNLLNMLNVAPQFSDSIVKQAFDLMGLAQPKQNPQQQMPQGQPIPGQQQNPQSQQQLTTNAVTPQLGQ